MEEIKPEVCSHCGTEATRAIVNQHVEYFYNKGNKEEVKVLDREEEFFCDHCHKDIFQID